MPWHVHALHHSGWCEHWRGRAAAAGHRWEFESWHAADTSHDLGLISTAAAARRPRRRQRTQRMQRAARPAGDLGSINSLQNTLTDPRSPTIFLHEAARLPVIFVSVLLERAVLA